MVLLNDPYGIFPYIGLIYGRYLQFRFLKWPLKWVWCTWKKVCQAGAAGTRNRSEGASFEGADCFASWWHHLKHCMSYSHSKISKWSSRNSRVSFSKITCWTGCSTIPILLLCAREDQAENRSWRSSCPAWSVWATRSAKWQGDWSSRSSCQACSGY